MKFNLRLFYAVEVKLLVLLQQHDFQEVTVWSTESIGTTKLAAEEIASKFTRLGSITFDDATTIQKCLEFSDGRAFLNVLSERCGCFQRGKIEFVKKTN